MSCAGGHADIKNATHEESLTAESDPTETSAAQGIRSAKNIIRALQKGDIVASVAWTPFPHGRGQMAIYIRRREFAVALGGAQPAPGEIN